MKTPLDDENYRRSVLEALKRAVCARPATVKLREPPPSPIVRLWPIWDRW